MHQDWHKDFIAILQAFGADIINRDEARILLGVEALVTKAGKK